MNSQKMKLISLLLVFACLFLNFNMLPVAAATTGTDSNGFAWQSDVEGTCSITGYSGSSANITIPGSINGYTVTSIANNAFRNTPVRSVTIPSTVTSIGGFAFYYCTSLTSITIPNSVTSIGESAFAYCTSLTNITLPNNLSRIENCAFQDCKALSGVILPNSVTSIGIYAFFECTFTSITIPNNVTSIEEGAFKDCKSLKTVSMPDSVTNIGNYLFYGCTSLSNLRLSSRLTSISNFMFYRCYALTNLAIPSGVKTIGNSAFEDCTALTNITIPNSVITIGYRAFIMCQVLSNVTIPSSVKTIGFNAFAHCYAFTNIIIPNSVTSLGDYAFYYCKSLSAITIPNSVTSIGFLAFDSCNSNFVIKGYSNSYAKSYASSNAIAFQELDYEGSSPSTPAQSSVPQSSQSSSTQSVPSGTAQSPQGENPQASQSLLSQSSQNPSLQSTQSPIFSSNAAIAASSNASSPAKMVGSVRISPNTIHLAVGEKQSLVVTILPAEMHDQAVTWYSSNESVATVDKTGTVTAKALGGATITAKVGTKTAVCLITVANNAVTLKESANKLSITADKSILNGAVKLTVTDIANKESGLNSQFSTKYSVVYCFDAKLEDVNGKGVEPSSDVLVTVPLSPSMLENANRYLILYIDNSGTAYEIQPTVVENHLEFTTNHFSRYAVVLANKVDDPASIANSSTSAAKASISPTNNPSRGNMILFFIIGLVLCIGIAAGIVIFLKKKKS